MRLSAAITERVRYHLLCLPSTPLHSRAVIYTSESRLLVRQRYMEGCELIRGSRGSSSWIYEVFGILWYLHVSRDSIFTGIDDFVDEMFKKFKNEKILKNRRLVKLARKKRWRIWGGKNGRDNDWYAKSN